MVQQAIEGAGTCDGLSTRNARIMAKADARAHARLYTAVEAAFAIDRDNAAISPPAPRRMRACAQY